MRPVSLSPRRVACIAFNTLREAVRQKFLNCLVLLAGLLVLGAQGLRDFHFGSPELKFLADLGFGAMAAVGTVVAVVAMSQLFFSEIEHRTVLTLLAKPVWRAEFVLGKLLGVAVLTAGFCALLTALLVAVLWHRESALMREWPDAMVAGRVVDFGQVAVTGLVQWLRLLVLSALTLLVASYARTQLFTTVMGFLVAVICQLQPLALAASARTGSAVGGAVMALLLRAVPNFQLFAVAGSSGGGEGWRWDSVGKIAGYATGYVAVAGGLAVFCFRRREL